jgi:uncharacterized protein YutE (UPF0331/DUF86 family)
MPLSEREVRLLEMLQRHVELLRSHLNTQPERSDRYDPSTAVVERWLQVAVQCCLDLGDSVLASLGLPEPPRYRDVFAILAKADVIGSELVEPLEALAGYRNALVHMYESLSPPETWQRAGTGVRILDQFAGCIERWARPPGESAAAT